MASSGARVPRRIGVAHVGKDDLKVLLILLDGWEGCTWVRRRKEGMDTLRWLVVVHVCPEG